MIRKEGSKYVVRSHRTGRNLGTYKTRAEAVKRLQQIETFKKKR